MTRMWLGPVLVLVMIHGAACGSRQVGPESGAGDGKRPARLQQVVAVDWVLEATPGAALRTRVALALTDETGATSIERVGEVSGRCQESTPTDAILAAECEAGPAGIALRVRRYGSDLVLLRATVESGVALDQAAFEEVGRVAIPPGAVVRAKE